MFENIFQEGVLVHIHIRRWGGKIALSPQDLGLKNQDVPAEFRLGDKYLVPEAEINLIRAIELTARRSLTIRSFKFPVGSLSFVPRGALKELQAELEDSKKEFDEAVGSLVERYDDIISKSGKRFVKIASELWDRTGKEAEKTEFVKSFLQRIRAALPRKGDLKDKFSFKVSVFTVALPDGGAELQELNTHAQDEAKAQINEFLSEVVSELRQQTYEICTRVATSIAEGKVVTENTMSSLRTHIERFQQLNFVQDETINKQLERLKKEYLKFGAKDIREESELKAGLHQALVAVAEKASQTSDISKITGRVKRYLDI